MKYSIRDLFLLTFIVAIAAGWWVDRSMLAKRDAEWHKHSDGVLWLLSKESREEHFFVTPAGPYAVNRRPDPENGRGTGNPSPGSSRLAIHLCDWHHVPKKIFTADLLSEASGQYTDEEIDRHYASHLAAVEAVQAEQVEHLRALIRQHDLKHVWVEGLTQEDMSAFRAMISVLKSAEKDDTEHRELLLRVGAPGRLLVTGELAEVLLLDDESTHRAADPLREGGSVVLSEADNAARENAMAQRLLSVDEPVSVIVLGAAHDLTDLFDGQKVEYRRIAPRRVEQIMAE